MEEVTHLHRNFNSGLCSDGLFFKGHLANRSPEPI